MQSDDREVGDGRDPQQSSDWSSDGFDDFEPFESMPEEDDPAQRQGSLPLSEASSDEPVVALDPFDDTFESSFDAETGAVDVAEDEDAVEVPEFASFTVGEDEGDVHTAAGEPDPVPATSAGRSGANLTVDEADDDTEEMPRIPAPLEEGPRPEPTPLLSAVPDPAAGMIDPPDDPDRDMGIDDDEEDLDIELTSERYLQTTTQEFVDLAEEIARSAQTQHVPSAVAAAMPGLETGVVGLEDVMAASGHDPSVIPPRTGSDLALRVLTGVGLAVIFFASLYSELLVGLFMFLVLITAAVEFYSSLMRSGHRPVGLFGLLGTAGCLLGTWVWGPRAIPAALIATLIITLVFMAMGGSRQNASTDLALTLLGAAWIGGLGAFVFDMVESPHYGWLIVATIVTVAVMDVAQYFVGRRLGRMRLAPRVSPNKTVEGLVGGIIVAAVVGVVFGLLQDPVLFFDLNSPIDLGAGLAIGLVVAAAAPFGDLAVSVMKRSMGVKDMGTVLPGHGGLLDRIDAMLFAIPLAWIVFAWTGLLV